jgi:NAD(P)-dependent dehydrogenase (short-subunit alcohol dehydrogenase family)
LNERATTVEGFEASFATNVLGTAALTARMLPALVAGAPARVITVTSGGLYSAAGLQLEQLRQQQGQLRQPDGVQWDGAAAYSRDKRRQLALTEHWAATVGSQSGALSVSHAHRFRGSSPPSLIFQALRPVLAALWARYLCPAPQTTSCLPPPTACPHLSTTNTGVAATTFTCSLSATPGVSFYAMHPGWADTEGVRTSIPGFHKAFQAKLRDTAQGVDTILWLALEDEARLTPGALYLDRATQPKALPLTGTGHTPAQAAALHDTLMGLAGLPVSSGG